MAGGESEYIVFKTASTSLHRVCYYEQLQLEKADIITATPHPPQKKKRQIKFWEKDCDQWLQIKPSIPLLKCIRFHTSIDRSNSFSVDDFPCPLKSIAITLAFSLILLAAKANESLGKCKTKTGHAPSRERQWKKWYIFSFKIHENYMQVRLKGLQY